MVKAFSVPTDAKIAFGSVELPIGTVSYIEGLDHGPAAWLIRWMGAGAMTGNKLFLDHVILLDMANRRFGIVSPERPETVLALRTL